MVTDPVRDNDNNNNMAPLKWRDRLHWQKRRERGREQWKKLAKQRGNNFNKLKTDDALCVNISRKGGI